MNQAAIYFRVRCGLWGVLACLVGCGGLASGQVHSALWGEHGEAWSPCGRLADWSLAGYARGERSIPTREITLSVRDFGARGDGEHDDTGAFRRAIAAVGEGGVIGVPAGRYVISDTLDIRASGVVLRGAGPDETTLYFPRSLTDIEPAWTTNAGGRRTSSYSWSGGFIRVQGGLRGGALGGAGPAERGDFWLPVERIDRIEPGMEITLTMRDDAEHTLTHFFYAGDPGPIENIRDQIQAVQVFRVVGVDRPAGRIRLDRPLRFDVREAWRPVLTRFEPGLTGVGIEGMTFEFPADPYRGHFTEVGHNGIAMRGVAHSWIRDVRFVNAESGIFFNGYFSTIDGVVFESDREPDRGGNRGHHAIMVSGGDNLTTRFEFRVRYIHDITVTRGSIGNVFSNGSGVDVNFDHHRRGPYENLFTDIDVGEGSRVWASGGGGGLGRHSAAGGTFWNIRSRRAIPEPGRNFAPDMINIVGIRSNAEARTGSDGRWFEPLDPDALSPRNLHEAQRARRAADQAVD